MKPNDLNDEYRRRGTLRSDKTHAFQYDSLQHYSNRNLIN